MDGEYIFLGAVHSLGGGDFQCIQRAVEERPVLSNPKRNEEEIAVFQCQTFVWQAFAIPCDSPSSTKWRTELLHHCIFQDGQEALDLVPQLKALDRDVTGPCCIREPLAILFKPRCYFGSYLLGLFLKLRLFKQLRHGEWPNVEVGRRILSGWTIGGGCSDRQQGREVLFGTLQRSENFEERRLLSCRLKFYLLSATRYCEFYRIKLPWFAQLQSQNDDVWLRS